MNRRFTFLIAAMTLLVKFLGAPQLAWGQKDVSYSLVTSADQLVAGKHYIIVSGGTDGDAYYLSNQDTDNRNRKATGISITNYKIAINGLAYDMVLSGNDGNWTFYDVYGPDGQGTEPGYLYASSSDNDYLELQSTLDNNGRWSISIGDSGAATIVGQGTNSHNVMQFNSSSSLFSCYASASQSPVYLYVKDNDNACIIYSDTDISSDRSISGSMNILSGIVTVIEDIKLTVRGTLNNNKAANLVIEDGGQLICSNSVPATVQKSIAGAGTETTATGWCLISSPISEPSIYSSSVANLITDSGYDLFRYNESDNSWQNFKVEQDPVFTSFEIGRGYLYRNAANTTVTFKGNININTYVEDYALSYSNANESLKGLNIIGNPLTYDILWGDIDMENVNVYGYYTLETNGNWTVCSGDDLTSNYIAPMQGILVKANGDDPYVSFGDAKKAKETDANNDYIKFVVSNSQYEDVTYALFDKGEGLNKINHRNAEIPMLYIPQDSENYAIATMDDDSQMFGLSFKAMTMGKYTLSYKTKGEFSYLHVIDRLTGEDVDMLLDGEYSFMGSLADADDRFVVKLSHDANGLENSSDIFAYQNGTDIIVEGEGELQVFDIMGRHIMNTNVNGTKIISTSTLNRGVYVMKLNGKVQKIIVK